MAESMPVDLGEGTGTRDDAKDDLHEVYQSIHPFHLAQGHANGPKEILCVPDDE